MQKKRLWFFSIVIIMSAALVFSGCFKGGAGQRGKMKKRRQQAMKEPMPEPTVAEQQKTEQTPFDTGEPKAEPIQKQQPVPAIEAGPLAGLEKLDSSEASCNDFCRKWCPKASKCKVRGLEKVQRCAKLCWTTCRKSVVPKQFADCVLMASNCDKVKECFLDLKELRQKALEKQKQEGQQALPAPAGGDQAPPPASGDKPPDQPDNQPE